MPEKKQFVIGIDGGGTKTTAMIADLSGKVLSEATEGPSNFQIIGVEKSARILFHLIDQCSAAIGSSFKQVDAVVAGLTGAGRESDKRMMREAFLHYSREEGVQVGDVVIESDARIALEGAFRGKEGIILIVGTGSIAFGKDFKGVIHRVGGWGRLLGDEGSGYAIGRDGLNAVTKHLDGRTKGTMLTNLVAQRFGMSSQEEMIDAVYKENFDIASVAPLVIEAAGRQDLDCARILNKATFELAEHVRGLTLKIEAASKGRARQKLPLALVGSLATTDTVYSKILKHRITSTLPQITIVKPLSPPAFGAVLMAIEHLKH